MPSAITVLRYGKFSSKKPTTFTYYYRCLFYTFSYDKRRYQNEDDFDDRAMENNKFASIMMEEARSAKIGRREDLEDMRREEEEKKRKRRR